MAYQAILSTEIDAESPIDDNLMSKIKGNFDDHESRLQTVKAFPLEWKINTILTTIATSNGKIKRLDGLRQLSTQTMSLCQLALEKPGTSGTLDIDIRKYRQVSIPIQSVLSVFSANINSISQIAPATATQSISRVTAQISTQSITLFKSPLNVSSIILLGNNLVRYNLSGTVDADWIAGDSVLFASCSNAANNGTFTIVRSNDDGGNNLIITNASGVAQTTAAGNASLRAYSYNFTNPVSSEFVAGEIATMASHTAGASDGAKTIYAINQGGNNIIVKDAAGVAQGSAAGNVNVNRWVFSFSASAPSDFVVGEKARTASHTSGANNGDFTITGVNQGGNNIVVYNAAGVAQGAAAGTVNTCRWVYALASSPVSSFTIGQNVIFAGATDSADNGVFVVKQINRSGTDNLVVYNTAGVAQAGAAGTATHSNFILNFSSDQSGIFSTDSNIEVIGTVGALDDGFFDVLEINRGGGANYNVVVNNSAGAVQASAAGRIVTTSKSIFSTRPKITWSNNYLTTENVAAVFSTEAQITSADVTNKICLALDIISIPSGVPENLTVQLV
jgi:hypothetical protein